MSEKCVSRSPAIAARRLGDEMLIMSAADSTLFSLNPVATCIWQAADGLTPLSEIVESRSSHRRPSRVKRTEAQGLRRTGVSSASSRGGSNA